MLSNTRRRMLRAFATIAAIFFASNAGASFHLWSLKEIYSDASGAVQYIELTNSYNGEQFLTGHTVVATQGTATNVYLFPSDLPGDSAGHSFLIGTQSFADLGILTPDYVVPDRFQFLANGSVNFAGVDNLTYSVLPTDGVHALNRSGQSVVNSPTNFAGQTAVLDAASLPAAAIPIYRFNNTIAGVHCYTGSEAEKDTIIASYPWFSFEGTAYYALTQP